MPAKLVHVVDDDPGVLDSIKLVLELSGFEVRAYSRAASFLEEAPTARGCVLVDLGLPGIGGLQLQQELDRRKIRLPVIMMTGRLDDAARDEATSAGAFGYLTKPFAPDALIDMIEHALAANL